MTHLRPLKVVTPLKLIMQQWLLLKQLVLLPPARVALQADIPISVKHPYYPYKHTFALAFISKKFL